MKKHKLARKLERQLARRAADKAPAPGGNPAPNGAALGEHPERTDARYRACVGKIKFLQTGARALAEARGEVAYRCRFCTYWHVASKRSRP